MIRIKVHAVLGHSQDEDVLIGDNEIHVEFVKRLGQLIRTMRKEYPETTINVGVTEDTSVTESGCCPACGDRESTIL